MSDAAPTPPPAPTRRASSAVAALTIVSALAVASSLVVLAVRFPATPPLLDPAVPAAGQVEPIERIERELIDALPPLSATFAWWAADAHDGRRRGVLSPDDWELQNRTHAERVERFNDNVRLFRARYLSAVALLVSALGLGALAAGATLARGASPLSLLLPLGCCFAVTPVITEPVIGNDFGSDLLPFVLPILIGGAALLLMNLGAFVAPAEAVGGFVGRRPWLAALLGAILFGGIGAALIAIGVAESMEILLRPGAVFVANAIVLLLGAIVLGLAGLLGGRGARPDPSSAPPS